MMILTVNQAENLLTDFVKGIDRPIPFNCLIDLMKEYLGIDFSGNLRIAHPDDSDITLWQGLSRILAEAIVSAVGNGRLFLLPALAKQYKRAGMDLRDQGFEALDGCSANLSSPKPKWLPMTISPHSLSQRPPPFLTPLMVAEILDKKKTGAGARPSAKKHPVCSRKTKPKN